MEIPGPDGGDKADLLADRLRTTLGDGIIVTKPMKMAEFRIIGLDISATAEEIRDRVAAVGGCLVSDIHVGEVRKLPNGTLATWVRCPAIAASKLSSEGEIEVGWALARVDGLKVRPTQCFRCWHFGHVRNACKAGRDRTGLCFRCGQEGHSYKACDRDLRCVVFADNGLEASHRLGSTFCPSAYKRIPNNNNNRNYAAIRR